MRVEGGGWRVEGGGLRVEGVGFRHHQVVDVATVPVVVKFYAQWSYP